jgi:hypothetical protein
MSCRQNEFKCSVNNRCLPESKRCDGQVDCYDGQVDCYDFQDETGCKTDCDHEGQEGQVPILRISDF